MSAALWAAVTVLGLAVPAREAARLEVRVTAADPSSGGDADDAGLTGALAQALIDAGLPATRGREGDAPCDDGCLRVLVHRTDAQRFLVEVRAPAESLRAELRIGAAGSGSASAFDLAHALAIQVEVLAERARAHRRRAPRTALASTTPAAAPPPAVVPAADATAAAAAPTPGPPATSPTTRDETTLPLPPIDEPPALQAAPAAVAPVAPADARLALDVAALVLAGLDGDLLMHGVTVGARVRLGHGGDLRAGIAFLRPERRSMFGTSYQREILPLQLAVSSEIPRVRALRVGVGVEAVLMSGEVSGRERPGDWTLGAIGRVEYRHAIRSVVLLASGQAALHPPLWRMGPADPLPLADMPPWTVSAGLGLEFTVF